MTGRDAFGSAGGASCGNGRRLTPRASYRYLVGQSLIHALPSPCRYLRGLTPLFDINVSFPLFFFFFKNGGLGERERVCVLVQRETRLGLGFLEVLQRTHALLVVTVADHDHAFHFLPDLDDDLVSQKLDAVVSVGDL